MANPISKLNLAINGVTTQLDVHDANALTTEIDSMGTDWVRFKSGLQICYGKVINNNNLGTGIARFSFPKVFSAKPSVVASPNVSERYVITCLVESEGTWVLNTFAAWVSPIDYTGGSLQVSYVAIGKWK